METLDVLVVDDHALMREAVRLLLEGQPGLRLAGEADSAAAALELVGRLEPDLVLLDLRLPDLDSLVCLDRIKQRRPGTTVVIFAETEDPELLPAALRRGAAAWVLKSINPLDLPAILRPAVERAAFQAPAALLEAAATSGAGNLTDKEIAVLEQLAHGRSNREIAATLWISEQTVKFHLRNVYRKLGASNRTEALRVALERAVLSPAA